MAASFSPEAAHGPPSTDVGLGTAYERRAISRRILAWCAAPPATALEGPLDGMAGMPGLHLVDLARKGTRVTVVHPDSAALGRVKEVYCREGLADRLELVNSDALPPGSFELVLSFNALPLAPDWEQYLATLCSRGRKVVLFVTHAHSYGAWLRRVVRVGSRGRRPELFDHPSTRSRELERRLAAIGRIAARAWVDCPWWPDLFVPAGDRLADAVFGPLGRRSRPSRFVYGAADYPHAKPRLPPDLARALARHPAFESSRLAPLFAHHRAYLLWPRAPQPAP